MPMPKNQPSVAIIGAGVSGLCMGIKLSEAGMGNFTIYEKAARVGGTWRENTYPGVACDVPSHLYSFSFAPKTDWSMVFSPGGEIQGYLESVAEKYQLSRHIQAGAELKKAEWKGDEWLLTFADDSVRTANYLINAIGGLHIPRYPGIPGADSFKGTAFHTARWNHDHDLTGRRVAIIGTAASAIQLIPEIVDKVAALDVYQRTANWIVPRAVMKYSARTKNWFRRLPWLAKLHRLKIYLTFEMRFPLFRMNKFLAGQATKMFLDHLHRQVTDLELRAKLTPDYPIGCKRILASDTLFPALTRDHISLITDGIDHITPDGIVTKTGDVRPVDTIIYATGFKPWDLTDGVSIIGRDGMTMADYLKDGIRAHKTVAMPGFPNHFMLLGPNSGLGHNSVILMIEAQVRYIMQAIKRTAAKGAKSVEVKPAAADHFDAQLQHDLIGTVWAGHCKSWYQGEDGRIYTLWPWSTLRYRCEMKKLDIQNYLMQD